MSDTLSQVQEIIARELCVPLDTLSSGSVLGEDVPVDSLETVQLIIALEEGFDIVIPESEQGRFVPERGGDYPFFDQVEQPGDLVTPRRIAEYIDAQLAGVA